MQPAELGKKYDKIAQWWYNQHFESSYGVKQFQRAMSFASPGGKALDVGCGAGGRFVRLLDAKGFCVTGLDVSKEMIKLASQNHPEHKFLHQDICTWDSQEKFDFIVAWDSIFHLPFEMQKPVVCKLCRLLAENGILIYSFGNGYGDHIDQWHNDTFYYSTIGIKENLQLLLDNGITPLHLALDQHPDDRHVYTIAIHS